MNIALIGLGSMGYNLAKNMVSKNYQVNAFEKNMLIVEKIKNENIQNLYLLNSIKDLVDKTPSPRIIMLSLPADKIDKCINDLIDHLNPTDIIADLGNSLYLKSIILFLLGWELNNIISFLSKLFSFFPIYLFTNSIVTCFHN